MKSDQIYIEIFEILSKHFEEVPSELTIAINEYGCAYGNERFREGVRSANDKAVDNIAKLLGFR